MSVGKWALGRLPYTSSRESSWRRIYVNDFDLPRLGRGLHRGGTGADEDIPYLGYADEARPQAGIGAIEVLAEVPSNAALPDDFGQSDLKYGRVKELFESPSYGRKSSWGFELSKIRIYIADPMGIVRAVTRYLAPPSEALQDAMACYEKQVSDEVAWKLGLLNPFAWLHSMDVVDGIELHGLGDGDRFGEVLDREFAAARSRKGDHLINTRRRLLRSQALNRALLPNQPLSFNISTGNLEVRPTGLPVRSLAHSLRTKMRFDEGHSADIPRLLEGQRRKEPLLGRLRTQYLFSTVQENCVVEASCRDSEHVQLADFAAGHAH
jgi:hypothetical protein